MHPDEPSSGQSGGAPTPSSHPQQPVVRDTSPSQREAATNVIRNQIDHLYSGQQVIGESAQPEAQPSTAPVVDENPYLRTHASTPQPEAEQWKAYHSAWQTYYQQYYEGYYNHHLKESTRRLASHDTHTERQYFGSQPAQETHPTDDNEPITKDEALFDLRQKLLGRVQASARKVRKSRHFVPIASAIGVVLIFVFLQYNSFIVGTVAAYISPGSINPQNIVIDPNSDIHVSADPRLIIPKINVDVPVAYDIGNDYDSQMAGMKNGVAHFAIPGANSHPGEVGNTVIAGHSSNDLFDGGDYKFIFVQLEKLTTGDTIYANYKGTRYTYVVTRTQVVAPTDVNALVYDTNKPMLTLLTCTPIGTALNRLLVVAEQVSPDPTAAATAPASTGTNSTSIPGNTSTLLEKLFGGNG